MAALRRFDLTGYGIIKLMEMVKNKAVLFLKMIRFSHSVFALPFAFTGAILAARGIPQMEKIFWITLAMVGARSGAMGLNRVIDRKIDAANPRTAAREIPSGKIRAADAMIFTGVSFALMFYAAYRLNYLCFVLAWPAIAVLIIYSFTKRFTWMSHFVLGIAISAAPLGAWIAMKGSFDLAILPLGIAVVFWLAGFDVLYALQDAEFDKAYGLHSIPQKFGTRKALFLSRVFHAVTWTALASLSAIFHLGIIYSAGLLVIGGLLIYEHSLVKENDLSRLDLAFFNMNGYISIAVFVFTLASLIA